MKFKRLVSHFCLFFSAVTSLQAETLSFSGDDWCPYNCTPNSEKEGYIIDILSQVFKNDKIKYTLTTWEKALDNTRHGQFDGVIGAFHEDAPDFIFPSQAVGVSQNCFWVLEGFPWTYDDIPSLEGVTLGVAQGYDYGSKRGEINAYLFKYRNNPKKVQFATSDDPLEENIQKLIKGEIKAFVENRYVVEYALKHKGLAGQIKEAGVINENPQLVYVAFSPEKPSSKSNAEILSNGIESLRKSGQLKEILQKYGLQDWTNIR